MSVSHEMSIGLSDTLRDQSSPSIANGNDKLELMKVFDSFSRVVSSEVRALKDRVIAHHEDTVRHWALENEQLRLLVGSSASASVSPTAPQTPPKRLRSVKSVNWDAQDIDCNGIEKFDTKAPYSNMPESNRNGTGGKTTVQGIAAARTAARKSRLSSQSSYVDTEKTKKLFSRLAHDEDFMTATRIHNILRIVHGLSCPMAFARVQQILDTLCANSIGDGDGPCGTTSYTTSHTSHKACEAKSGHTHASYFWGRLRISKKGRTLSTDAFHHGMDCGLFLRLMEWDALYSTLEEDFAVDCYIIRDALLKHGADLVIAYHARLELPEAVTDKPFEMQVLEPVSALVILLNALTIGLSADTRWSGWETFELMFTIFFTVEIALKFYYYGCRMQLLGPERYWNYFDMLLVGLAVADIFIQRVAGGSEFDMRDFTLARLARLAKVTRLMRLLRLLRLRIFKELLLMVRGVFAGLRTLFWAIVLLLFFVYTCSVALMQTIGEDDIVMDDRYKTALFQTLMWSMFNVFRCFMSDGSLPDGTPLVGHLEARYGVSFVIPYTFAQLFLVFGIFNLIAAIFVENVTASARAKRELTEDGERVRVALALRHLLLRFCGVKSAGGIVSRSRSSNAPSLTHRFMQYIRAKLKAFSEADEYKLKQGHEYFEVDGVITRDMFDKAIKDQETCNLLDDLEIHCDRMELFDVLDADSSGEIDIYEMISGLMKMRSGGADKSDGVATILSLRAVQETLRKLKLESNKIYRTIGEVQRRQESLWHSTEDLQSNVTLGSEADIDDLISL